MQRHWGLFGSMAGSTGENGEPLRQPLGLDNIATREYHLNDLEEPDYDPEGGISMPLYAMSRATSLSGVMRIPTGPHVGENAIGTGDHDINCW